MKQFIKNHPVYSGFVAFWALLAIDVLLEAFEGTTDPGDYWAIGVSGLFLAFLLVWISWEVREGIYALFVRMIAGKQPQEEMFQGMFKISKRRP